MLSAVRKLTVAAVCVSLCAASTSAIAAAPVAAASADLAATATSPTAVNPWVALSAMSGSSTAAAAAVAAQDEYVAEGPGFPPLPVLAVILATIGVGIWILVDDDDGEVFISPH
jgi:ABC-type transport system substrate-binding protein